jgi:hypothetical protein
LLEQWVNTINNENKNITDWTKNLQSNEDLLTEYNYYLDFFKAQRKLVLTFKENLPHELGVFEPKDSIRIALNTTNSHAIADYFATLTHEYLHYASYVTDDKKLATSFFEEGLTEYFARQTIQNDLNISTNLGYPVFVKIINQMTNLIPESEFAEIYFTKDEDALESALNRVYGDNFYQDNLVLFESLQYTSDSQQVLSLANIIMKKIGGAPLKESDLLSSQSKI